MYIIPDKIEAYCQAHSEEEPAYLKRIYRETHLKTLYPRMLSGHLQGRLLAWISRMLSPSNILEIGTFTGYSSLCLAEGLQPEGKLLTIEANAEFEDMILEHFSWTPLGSKIQLKIGLASEVLQTLKNEKRSFDLIFLDADKENYPNYYEILLELLFPKGLMIIDNTLWSGKVIDNSADEPETIGIKTFNTMVSQDNRVSCLILPLRDGITLVQKRN